MFFRRKKPLAKEQLRRTRGELERELEALFGVENYRSFKKFAFQKSMTEMAIAFMLGGALQAVISSLSNDVLMPIINYFGQGVTGGVNWRDYTVEPIEGLLINAGVFGGAVLDFLLIALVLFILYKKFLSPILADEGIIMVETIHCPHCYEKIFYKSKVCKYCTRDIDLINQ